MESTKDAYGWYKYCIQCGNTIYPTSDQASLSKGLLDGDPSTLMEEDARRWDQTKLAS